MATKSKFQKSPPRKSEFSIEKVQLEKIVGPEPFTSKFLEQHDHAIDLFLDLKKWNNSVVTIACLQSVFFLVKSRRNEYLYLGSGRMLALMRELLGPLEEVHALVVSSSQATTEFKLDVLAAELLLIPAIFRTRHLTPKKMLHFWDNLVVAGAAPICGSSVRSFARATGFSRNSLKGRGTQSEKP